MTAGATSSRRDPGQDPSGAPAHHRCSRLSRRRSAPAHASRRFCRTSGTRRRRRREKDETDWALVALGKDLHVRVLRGQPRVTGICQFLAARQLALCLALRPSCGASRRRRPAQRRRNITLQDLAPLQELERLRADFLGMVSHELRSMRGASRRARSRSPPSPRRWRRWSTGRAAPSCPPAAGTPCSSTCRRTCPG